MKHPYPSLFIDMDGTLVEWKTATYQQLLKEGFFRNGAPYQTVVEAIKILSKDSSFHTRMSLLSAYLDESKYAVDEKHAWADAHTAGIFPLENRFFVPTYSAVADRDAKVAFIEMKLGRKLTSSDVLLDDYSVNLHSWVAAGGTGLKLMNGINGTRGTWKGPKVSRFASAEAIAKKIQTVVDSAA